LGQGTVDWIYGCYRSRCQARSQTTPIGGGQNFRRVIVKNGVKTTLNNFSLRISKLVHTEIIYIYIYISLFTIIMVAQKGKKITAKS